MNTPYTNNEPMVLAQTQTMIKDTPGETKQISVDSQGNPVYAGYGYFLFGIGFVGVLIFSVVLNMMKRKQHPQA